MGTPGGFTTSFMQADTASDGTYFVVKHMGEGAPTSAHSPRPGGKTATGEGSSHSSCCSNPLELQTIFFWGVITIPRGEERGSIRSTNRNGYCSITRFVDLEGI